VSQRTSPRWAWGAGAASAVVFAEPAATPEATAGVDRPRATDRDDAGTDRGRLALELNRRARRASDLAAAASLDEGVRHELGDFQGRLRDFNTNASRMDLDDRRDRLGGC
jgi:hypothetical protein